MYSTTYIFKGIVISDILIGDIESGSRAQLDFPMNTVLKSLARQLCRSSGPGTRFRIFIAARLSSAPTEIHEEMPTNAEVRLTQGSASRRTVHAAFLTSDNRFSSNSLELGIKLQVVHAQ